MDAQLWWRHSIRAAGLVACTVCCQAMGCYSICVLLVCVGAIGQIAGSAAYLAIGSSRPLFQLAALGLGVQLQTLAGSLRLLLVIWIILILPHLQDTISLCVQRESNRGHLWSDWGLQQRLAAAHQTFEAPLTPGFMDVLTWHDKAQACDQVQTRFGGRNCSTGKSGMLQHWEAMLRTQLVSDYLEAASACCSLEGVCNPSKQCDGEQGVVSVFCNHLGRPGNLHHVSKLFP